MIKTKITETTEKFDKDGKLYERVTREETTEDDETRYPHYSLMNDVKVYDTNYTIESLKPMPVECRE